jgi:hypothetical protein
MRSAKSPPAIAMRAALKRPNGCVVDDVKRNSATHKARRARRADMSRADFIKLVAGWCGGVVLVLFISIFARYVS